jgi:hypothetical protein
LRSHGIHNQAIRSRQKIQIFFKSHVTIHEFNFSIIKLQSLF